MNRPVVKVCGLVRAEDAARAAALGADLLGMVLAEDSPRRATVDQVLAAIDRVGDGEAFVLVARAMPTRAILAAAARTGVRRVQLHAPERGQHGELSEHGLIPHRVLAVADDARTLPKFTPSPTAAAPALLDVGRGGSGRRFDWTLIGDRGPDHVLVAGGITPENLPELLAHDPYGVDVSSGIESAPGVKDPAAMERLFRQIGACS